MIYYPKRKTDIVYNDMIEQPHLLIAGATGSGKSVVLNGLLYTLLQYPKEFCEIYLIDPKKVELYGYTKCNQVIGYADETRTASELLNNIVERMERIYNGLRMQGLKKGGKRIYVFVDEMADLLTQDKSCEKSLIRLSQLARAANIHLITATQRPTADILNKRISVNLIARCGLHTQSVQDSRNIIGCKGCEDLPLYGKMLYYRPGFEKPELYTARMYTDLEIETAIEENRKEERKRRLFHF